ncbi:helix-turn-helix domain-containing protein [Streptomyces sp. NPDC001507]|uniref:helix-turn-helix domain-containing protein n=1 Tax=Streptomyces sp. NPDC001507 TaxID=3364579 RepID=UPI00367C919E
MTDENTAQGVTLAELRQLSGLSQLEVARRMGVSKARPGQIERDFPNVRFSVVEAYVRALGGRIEFAAVGPTGIWADEIVQHPEGPRDHGDRTTVRLSEQDELPEQDRAERDAWRARARRRAPFGGASHHHPEQPSE